MIIIIIICKECGLVYKQTNDFHNEAMRSVLIPLPNDTFHSKENTSYFKAKCSYCKKADFDIYIKGDD